MVRLGEKILRTSLTPGGPIVTRRLAHAQPCECCLGKWFQSGEEFHHTRQEALDAHITLVRLAEICEENSL